MKYTRTMILMISDVVAINLSIILSLLLRFGWHIPKITWNTYTEYMVLITGVAMLLFYVFGLYRSLWRYAGDAEVLKVFSAVTFAEAGLLMLIEFGGKMLPISVYIGSWLFMNLLVGGSRLGYRVARQLVTVMKRNTGNSIRVLVAGGGDAGAMVIRELRNYTDAHYEPVAVLDDSEWKWNTRVYGVPIKGGMDKLTEVCRNERIDEIIIAMPKAGRKRIAEIAKQAQQTGCKLKTLPGLYEIIDNKVSVKNIRHVSIEDLLGREETELNTAEIAGYLKNEVVLVTGGGGSIGSELCRQIAKFKPKKLIILDIYENTAYELQNELMHSYSKLNFEVVIASVRDVDRLKEVFATYRPGVVFHAAAHKHVPLMENNPQEAIKNNVLGTLNTARCADEFKVKRFVLISTDKAVNPTNIMGATKRVAEMIIQSIDKVSQTEFVAVRFGNVLGSNGSVIPLFKKQIARGGPVTVTHPEITRFFMTIPEASRLVIQAGAMANGGEIFVLDMGDPVKIVDLARELIRLSGFEPDEDIKIEFTGLKPGEKLYEELLMKEEGLIATNQQGIYIAPPSDINFKEVLMRVEMLKNSIKDVDEIRNVMAKVVTTYTFKKEKSMAVSGND